jgi:ABC-type enterobactin transport system permease subunit
MGDLVNGQRTIVAGAAVAALITALNGFLISQALVG